MGARIRGMVVVVIGSTLMASFCMAQPSVSNVRASQRAGTRLVDVYYDVSSANPPVTVSILVSTNGGAFYNLPASSFSGNVGAGVSPGSNRKITWDAGADWGGQFSSLVRFKVGASDGWAPAGFVLIPAGSFQMGDSFAEGSTVERPVHAVYVSAFYMQATETTKAQWEDVRTWASTHGYDLSTEGVTNSSHPQLSVTWYDAVKWCNARSEKEGLTPCCYTTAAKTTVYRTGSVNVANDAVDWNASGYRLPTEAEWEKAARGGADGRRFPWSDADTITHGRANYYSSWSGGVPAYPYDVNQYAGHHPTFTNGHPYTSPVGYFAPNGYGIYDMAGNAREWCWDLYYRIYSIPPSSDPVSSLGDTRVLRGGDWNRVAAGCRVAFRLGVSPGYRDTYGGFRAARR